MLRGPLDAVFPPRCAGCARGRWPFCEECIQALVALTPPWCERCGRPRVTTASCGACPPETIDRARAPFAYAGPARAAIHRLKFSGWRGVADALGSAMFATRPPAADVVTWVPLARRRLAERGYDQARALARVVAARLELPAARLLTRVRPTGPQARRPGAERRWAMRGAFGPARPSVPARILLVDDVLTTGATAGACAEVLRRAGARRVFLLTAARAFPAEEGVSTPVYTRTGSRSGLWLPGDDPR